MADTIKWVIFESTKTSLRYSYFFPKFASILLSITTYSLGCLELFFIGMCHAEMTLNIFVQSKGKESCSINIPRVMLSYSIGLFCSLEKAPST